MVTAWLSGDVERLSHQFMAEFGNTPALVRPLLTNRNKSWARQVEALMRRPGTPLIAVGKGHLVGRDSLQALLVKRGFRVRRLESRDFCRSEERSVGKAGVGECRPGRWSAH